MSLKLFVVEKEIESHSFENGKIISDGKTYFKVAVQGGFINIIEMQLAGKKRMKAEDFLRGFQGIKNYIFI
jgi:methionyl-tRNA formyltransferase